MSGVSGAIIANRSTDKRRALDFYPTPPDVTHALMQFLRERGFRWGVIWEPAAGDGAMADVLRQYNEVFETDISTGQDFLTYELDLNMRPGAIVTNPPFNLSEQFIRRALSITPNVAMVFKSQFWHAQKRLELFREHEPSFVLPLTWRPDFGGGGAPTMEVLWTVWTEAFRGPCQYIPLERPQTQFIQL